MLPFLFKLIYLNAQQKYDCRSKLVDTYFIGCTYPEWFVKQNTTRRWAIIARLVFRIEKISIYHWVLNNCVVVWGRRRTWKVLRGVRTRVLPFQGDNGAQVFTPDSFRALSHTLMSLTLILNFQSLCFRTRIICAISIIKRKNTKKSNTKDQKMQKIFKSGRGLRDRITLEQFSKLCRHFVPHHGPSSTHPATAIYNEHVHHEVMKWKYKRFSKVIHGPNWVSWRAFGGHFFASAPIFRPI